MSRDFGSECLNTGVIYAKSHRDTAAFFDRVLVWMWQHPFEFTQKCFSAFLGTESVVLKQSVAGLSKVEAMVLEPIPRWAQLDPLSQYVTSMVYGQSATQDSVEGWTGDISDIVVYHFLDGGGAVDPSIAVQGDYFNYFDLFYANEALLYYTILYYTILYYTILYYTIL